MVKHRFFAHGQLHGQPPICEALEASASEDLRFVRGGIRCFSGTKLPKTMDLPLC